MGLKTEIVDRILEIFYEYPGKEFTVRELSGISKVPRSTVQKYLAILRKGHLITKDNSAENSLLFRTKKTNFFIEKIVDCGLIDYISTELNPSCIILFGSIRKGESTKESDIDIFVETSLKVDLSMRKFERRLGHKIQIFLENDINDMPIHLMNNIVNGIKLHGSFAIKRDKK